MPTLHTLACKVNICACVRERGASTKSFTKLKCVPDSKNADDFYYMPGFVYSKVYRLRYKPGFVI